MKKLVLIGSKEFASQIREFAEETRNYVVVGYLDDYEEVGTQVQGLPILGSRRDALELYSKGVFDCLFLAAGYKNFKFREEAFSELKGKIPFANIISKSAYIAPNCILGEGIFIGAGSNICSNTVIEDNVFIHGYTFLAHDNHIGAHSYLSGRLNTAGFVTLGKRNFAGICSMYSDHVKTADDVWVGLGCIIIRNIKESGKYMVNPKLIKIE